MHDVTDLYKQTKLYEPLTSHAIAAFEDIVSAACQLLATAVARPQSHTVVRSDTTSQHQSTAGAGRTDAEIFRHRVRGISFSFLLFTFV